MNVPQSKHQVTGTVTTELNAYGAMTLRSEDGQTLQIVDATCEEIVEQLEALTVDDTITVSLAEAPCRGRGWCVTAVVTECSSDEKEMLPA